MYQSIVLGLGFLLLLGGGYLIKHMDQEGVIESSVASSDASYVSSMNKSSIAGTYVCDTDSKCPNPRVLTLGDDGVLTLTTSYEDGAQVLQENGTWDVGTNKIMLMITGTQDESYTEQKMLFLKRLSELTLVPDISMKTTYKDLGNPIFRKQLLTQE